MEEMTPEKKLDDLKQGELSDAINSLPDIDPNSPEWKDAKAFAKGRGVNPTVIAKKIIEREFYFCCGDEFYKYAKLNGVYKRITDDELNKEIFLRLGERYRLSHTREVRHCLKTFKAVRAEMVNEDPHLLNLRNGMFNVRNCQVTSHAPSYLSTIQLPVSYSPEAKCFRWEQFMDEVMEGDKERIGVLQEFSGLCLTRSVKHAKFLLLVGNGANGKSVFSNTLRKVVGKENTSCVGLENFSDARFLGELFGKLVNIATESAIKSADFTANLKKIVSGEPIEANAKWKPIFEFQPFAKLIFPVNELPMLDDRSMAVFRRCLIVPFNAEFLDDAKRDINLEDKLESELDGIFCWAVEGLKRLEKRGYFVTSEVQKKIVDEYRADQNPIIGFTEECCLREPEEVVAKGDLYTAYYNWCLANGFKQMNANRFSREFARANKFVESYTSHGLRKWKNLRLKNSSKIVDF